MNEDAHHSLMRDQVMAQLIERIGPIEMPARRLPPFQSLTDAVIQQHLSGKAAGTILGRFLALFGRIHSRRPKPV